MAASQGQKILKKLTIREAIGGKGVILAAAQTGKQKPDATVGVAVPLLRVIGQCTAIVPGESDNGPYVKLKGMFKATNLITGEILDNIATAILPNMVGDSVAAGIMSGAKAVDFAVEIDVNYDEDAATMYVFSARSLLAAEPAAPLLGIEALLAKQGVQLSIPAPKAIPQLSHDDAKKQEAKQKEADAGKGKTKATA